MQLQPLTKQLEDDHEALAFAVKLACRNHTAQVRKGTKIPYLSHLLQVAGMVLEYGGTLTQAAAGVLHDVIEDTTLDIDDVRLLCGPEVAKLVAACTDTDPSDSAERSETGEKIKAPWRTRKERYLTALQTIDPAAALIVGCDKLHNLNCQNADLWHEGKTVEFNASLADRMWLAEATLAALCGLIPERLLADLTAATHAWMRLQEADDPRVLNRDGRPSKKGGFTPPTGPAEPRPAYFEERRALESAELETTDRMIKLPGSENHFRCDCGCNVFRHPVGFPLAFVCNSCKARWTGEPPVEES